MIFLDTSAFYAMEVKQDIKHGKASAVKAEIAKNMHGVPVTTNYVIAEAITLLRYRTSHQSAVAFGEKIRSSKILKIIRVGDDTENRAWEIFKEKSDTDLSFVDCTSFAIMEEMGIQNAFAFDEHFAQAGFKTLGL